MKNLCNSCPHGKRREECHTLCSEAEIYANQDYVGRERAFNILGIKKWRGAIQFRVPTDPKEKAREVMILHRHGYTDEDISIHLECSPGFIHEVLDWDNGEKA